MGSTSRLCSTRQTSVSLPSKWRAQQMHRKVLLPPFSRSSQFSTGTVTAPAPVSARGVDYHARRRTSTVEKLPHLWTGRRRVWWIFCEAGDGVTPVGSFPTTGSLDGAWSLDTRHFCVCERATVDCATRDSGCNGDNAFATAEKNGICTKASYTYRATGGTCPWTSLHGDVDGFQSVATDSKQAQKPVLSQRPGSIVIEADRSRPGLCPPVQDRCARSLPEEFTRCHRGVVNHCTLSRNQHIPQYRGSC